MFYAEEQVYDALKENKNTIFELMKEGLWPLVDKMLSKKMVSLSLVDEEGNTVLMKLVKLKQYSMALKYMGLSDVDINHQNNDGNTFAHLLATKDYIKVAPLIKKLKRNKEFSPNLKNNEGKTILDLSIESGNLCTTLKFLEDKRFDNIDVVSFIHLYKTFIKNNEYGKYTKLSNLEVVVDHLEKKEDLLPRMKKLIDMILENFDRIKSEILGNKLTVMDQILDTILVEKEG